MKAIKAMVPEPAKRVILHVLQRIRSIPYYGRGRYCPVCQHHARRFRTAGTEQRIDAQCPFCNALERHRLLWLFMQKHTDLFDGTRKRVLHVAPEPCLEKHFRKQLGDSYITADLVNPRAMVKMDITDIQYPDESFDVIYCSHVLEHVQEDRKAMRELHRVLKQNGWAVLLVPITADKTFEDPSITDPQERLKAFGLEDHVRRYGPDYADRLREGGFDVSVSTAGELASASDIVRMGLTPACGEIFFCRRS